MSKNESLYIVKATEDDSTTAGNTIIINKYKG